MNPKGYRHSDWAAYLNQTPDNPVQLPLSIDGQYGWFLGRAKFIEYSYAKGNCGVYFIYGKRLGLLYVGKSIDLDARIRTHESTGKAYQRLRMECDQLIEKDLSDRINYRRYWIKVRSFPRNPICRALPLWSKVIKIPIKPEYVDDAEKFFIEALSPLLNSGTNRGMKDSFLYEILMHETDKYSESLNEVDRQAIQ